MKTILIMLVSLCFVANTTKGAFVVYFVGSDSITYNITEPQYIAFSQAGWESGTPPGHTTTAAWGAVRTTTSPGQPDFLSLAFAAPNGQDLTVGMYAAGKYGGGNSTIYRMDVSASGIPATLVSGWYNVLEIGFDANNIVNMAAIDFNITGNPGTLRFNSNIPLSAIPEPGAPLLIMSSFILLWRRVRRR